MKTNNSNDFSKRTANQVKAILTANGINSNVVNLGDGRNFEIDAKPEIKTLMILKQIGFIRTSTALNSICFKAF